jgi:putative inorganic carbon (HCO3(-)) transporter
MTQGSAFWRAADLAMPFAWMTLMPVLPMIVLLADVLPRGVAIGGKGYAAAFFIIITLAALTTLAALVAQRGWRGLVAPPMSWPLLAMIATAMIAGVVGVSLRAASFEILSEIGDFILFVAVYYRMGDDRLRRALLTCFFSAGIIATVFGIALTLTRHPPEMFSYQHGRAAGTFLQPNEFGGYLLFFIALGIAQAGAPPLLRRLGFTAAAIGIVALALAVSRAAWLGLIVGLPILVWRLGRKAVVVYVIAAAATLVLGTTTFRDVAHDPSENTSRIAVWQGALRMAERFALTGVGPLGFSKVYPSLKQPDAAVDEVHAHDLPLNVLVENGVLGLAAFIWAVVAGVREALRARARLDPKDRERVLLFYGIAAAFIASAVQNVLDVVSTFVFLLWWPMLGLMLSLAPAAQSRALERGPRAQEPGTTFTTAQERGSAVSTRAQERRTAFALVAACVLVLAIALDGCGHAGANITATPVPTEPPVQAQYYIVAQAQPGRPVELKEFQKGSLEYLLRADQIAYQTADSKGTLRNVALTFYKGRVVRLRVTAPTAEVLPNSRNVALRGGVRAASATGAAMAADSMEYDGNRHVLTAAGGVRAHAGRGNSIDGDRAEADLDLRRVRVWGPHGEQTMTFGK